jgi:hypothetical protein
MSAFNSLSLSLANVLYSDGLWTVVFVLYLSSRMIPPKASSCTYASVDMNMLHKLHQALKKNKGIDVWPLGSIVQRYSTENILSRVEGERK